MNSSSPSSNIAVLVSGMTCNRCRLHVEAAIKAVSGVDSVSVDLASGKATIALHGNIDEMIDAIKRTITASGYVPGEHTVVGG